MATFITSLILYGFIAFVIGAIGKLIYEVQQNKKLEKQDEFEAKDRFQKLAGIGQPKNELDPEIWKYVADKVSKEGFPEPDVSIPVTTAKLTTIETKFEDYDPLTSVPMSRVSKQAKKKMAQIAKEDINKQLEQNAEKFATLFPNELQSEIPNEIKEALLKAPSLKPKRKSNPKQMDGILIEEPFVKSRKKATKKTKK
jgi:hypothetical protein